MDYLINEGYPSAAKKFALEANIPTTEDIASIQERVEIKNAIHRGDIQCAIERINELNHQVCDSLIFSAPFQWPCRPPATCYDYTLYHAPLIYSSE
jgi:hypothetical protein